LRVPFTRTLAPGLELHVVSRVDIAHDRTLQRIRRCPPDDGPPKRFPDLALSDPPFTASKPARSQLSQSMRYEALKLVWCMTMATIAP